MNHDVIGHTQATHRLDDSCVEVQKVLDLDRFDAQGSQHRSQFRQIRRNFIAKIGRIDRFGRQFAQARVTGLARLEHQGKQSLLADLPDALGHEALDAPLEGERHQQYESTLECGQSALIEPTPQRTQRVLSQEIRDEAIVTRMAQIEQPLAAVDQSRTAQTE